MISAAEAKKISKDKDFIKYFMDKHIAHEVDEAAKRGGHSATIHIDRITLAPFERDALAIALKELGYVVDYHFEGPHLSVICVTWSK